MIMMSYSWRWSSLQLTGQADFWQPTRTGDRAGVEDRLAQASPPSAVAAARLGLSWPL
jgi:hypothetical protein